MSVAKPFTNGFTLKFSPKKMAVATSCKHGKQSLTVTRGTR